MPHEAGGELFWLAVREPGDAGGEVARYLGVKNSCVTRSVAAEKRHPAVESFEQP